MNGNTDTELVYLEREYGLTAQLDCGWITEDGFYYGCNAHQRFAEKVFKTYVEGISERPLVTLLPIEGSIEKWILRVPNHSGVTELSDPQLQTLVQIGYDINDPMVERNTEISFEDIYPSGYKNHPFKLIEDLRTKPDLYNLYIGSHVPVLDFE